MCVCVYVCVCVCVYVCMCVYVCVYVCMALWFVTFLCIQKLPALYTNFPCYDVDVVLCRRDLDWPCTQNSSVVCALNSVCLCRG